MFKELQLTSVPAQHPDGSRTEQSGRGYFPGAFNGADVAVKDTKRFAATGGPGYFDFNHHKPWFEVDGDYILGFTTFGVGAAEIMSFVQIAINAGRPYHDTA